jgi:hypothetical protein
MPSEEERVQPTAPAQSENCVACLHVSLFAAVALPARLVLPHLPRRALSRADGFLVGAVVWPSLCCPRADGEHSREPGGHGAHLPFRINSHYSHNTKLPQSMAKMFANLAAHGMTLQDLAG